MQHIAIVMLAYYFFRYGKGSGMISILLAKNLPLEWSTKEYQEISVRNTQN